jgi:hypothetical protein
MKGKIESGQLCTVAPIDLSTLSVGDIVLCKVRGNEYLHIVKAINGPRYQIGNNRGLVNGWIGSLGMQPTHVETGVSVAIPWGCC